MKQEQLDTQMLSAPSAPITATPQASKLYFRFLLFVRPRAKSSGTQAGTVTQKAYGVFAIKFRHGTNRGAKTFGKRLHYGYVTNTSV